MRLGMWQQPDMNCLDFLGPIHLPPRLQHREEYGDEQISKDELLAKWKVPDTKNAILGVLSADLLFEEDEVGENSENNGKRFLVLTREEKQATPEEIKRSILKCHVSIPPPTRRHRPQNNHSSKRRTYTHTSIFHTSPKRTCPIQPSKNRRATSGTISSRKTRLCIRFHSFNKDSSLPWSLRFREKSVRYYISISLRKFLFLLPSLSLQEKPPLS